MFRFALFIAVLSCTAKEFSSPVIKLNSATLKQPEVIWSAKKPFNLRCDGQMDVIWKTRLNRHQRHISKNVLTVKNPTVEHTGTYQCRYKSQTDLYSEVHIYVKDFVKAFTTPQTPTIIKKEGSNYLLDCLVTDPASTEFSLQMKNGSSVPFEMNSTADPKRGILIRNLQPRYSGDYVCTVRINGVLKVSEVFHITVLKKAQRPPSVSLEANQYVRIVGEMLHIPCYTTNQDHSYNITWSSSQKVFKQEIRIEEGCEQICITSFFTIPQVNMSDTGNLTCTGQNEAGKNSVTTFLKVVDKPYIKLVPILAVEYKKNGTSIEVIQGQMLEISVQIEAYPEIEWTCWKPPKPRNTSNHEEKFHRIHNKNHYISTILLKRVEAQEYGHYIFISRSASVNASITFTVHVYQKPKAVIKWENGNASCFATGYPVPRIQWFQCQGVSTMCSYNHTSPLVLLATQFILDRTKEFDLVQVTSVLPITNVNTKLTIECVATNIAGEDRDCLTLRNVPGTISIWLTVLIPVVVVGAFCVGTLLLLSIYKYKEAQKYEIQWKIIQDNNGNSSKYIDPNQLPYDKKLEFPRTKLKLGRVLGAGAFGKVVQATAYGLVKDENVTQVAVKMLKQSACFEEKEALMSELKILSYIGPHDNIVNLLGACTQEGPMLMITEYCCHGDLLNFLRQRAETFVNNILDVHSLFETSNLYKNVKSSTGYQNAKSTKTSNDLFHGSCNERMEETWTLDNINLLKFSYQVSQGMDFLASKNCIHRDLAARNILITDCKVVKICDFGLARDIMNDLNYVVKGNARLPVKWMSPESIFECVYTVQSDVWSYGILLWEIFSLGMTPYPNVVIDAHFYKMIKEGYHMSQPDFAHPEMYTIMKMCWTLNPTLRPTFGNISEQIATLLSKELNQQMLYPEFQRQLMGKQCILAPESLYREETQPLMNSSFI
ncbi:macrophage colony-stimulating factor 1 receptor isoform X2 [Triplophysa dalaica]|uniref:macrophage colony-stimulating factor 1 receptor isoform X2 n=1 Tax=Triplophysa dalaica TaxID=1582913 RepID=UPI0024DF5238|nr:macrophage colony-stimulating factor 1 receptor isoform X2 [Triplophysa dalaica]